MRNRGTELLVVAADEKANALRNKRGSDTGRWDVKKQSRGLLLKICRFRELMR
jgi:hypothetical protein